MHIIIIIVLVLLAIVALLLIAGVFIPKKFTVSVSTIIDKPVAEVFDYVKMIRNQEKYNVWIMEDPQLSLTYSGTDGEVGFTSSWNSKIGGVGEGSQTIVQITPNERIDIDLHFIRPMPGDQKAATIVSPISENQTKVVLDFYNTSTYPFSILAYLIGGKLVAKAQKQTLANLKKILEN